MAIMQLQERVDKGKQLLLRKLDSEESLAVANDDYSLWDNYNHTLLESLFDTRDLAEEYSQWLYVSGGPSSLHDRIEDFHKTLSRKLHRLESIIQRLPLYASGQSKVPQMTASDSMSHSDLNTRKVFLVHGHDDGLKHTVARFLENHGIEVIILHEQPNAGQTIIEKFEGHSDAGYAVVLLTADDEGRLASASESANLTGRARQNVIFEWGFFVAKLGRTKVCAIRSGDIETPSDLSGLIIVEYDSRGAWKMDLVRELKAGGLPVKFTH